MSPAAARQRKLAYAAWVAVCLIWGTTYLGIRISLETMPPALMGGLRWTLAGVLLALVAGGAAARRCRRRRSWGSIALLGFLMLVLGNGGVVFAEQWVPSGLTAVLVATSPFWMAGGRGAHAATARSCVPRVVAGLVVGFSGIVLLVWPELTLGIVGPSRVPGRRAVAVQIAAFGWSLGSSYSKRHDASREHPRHDRAPDAGRRADDGRRRDRCAASGARSPSRRDRVAALLYLSTVGAIGGFVAYTYALRHLPVSFVSLYAYINPIIAVTLGVLLLHEPFTSRMAVAAVLVFAGVGVVRWARGTARRGRSASSQAPRDAAAGSRAADRLTRHMSPHAERHR